MTAGLKTHEYWMHKALDLARNALPEDVPVGALIISPAGEVIGQGWNRREQDSDPSAHAEIVALKQAGQSLNNWRLNECSLYVTLEPCPMCAAAILQARISQVVFGATDPVQGALGSAISLCPLYTNPITIIGGICETPCQDMLVAFFKDRRENNT